MEFLYVPPRKWCRDNNFLYLSTISIGKFLSLSQLISLLTLHLGLTRTFRCTLPFEQLYLLFLNKFLFFPSLPLPYNGIAVMLLRSDLHLTMNYRRHLRVKVAILFRGVKRFVRLFDSFLFYPLCLLYRHLTLLAFRGSFYINRLLFRLQGCHVLRVPSFFHLVLHLCRRLLRNVRLCRVCLGS